MAWHVNVAVTARAFGGGRSLRPKPEYATQELDTAEQAAASRQKNQGALRELLVGRAVKPIENVDALQCFSQ